MRVLAQHFPEAEKIILIQDHLNTHQLGSFYSQLDPAQAFTLAQRFDWLYTPNMPVGSTCGQALWGAVLPKTG
jgi:hypothetical protein